MTNAELERLMERYQNLVWTVVHSILQNPHDCEEVCADVFVSLWKSDFKPDAVGSKSFIITLSKRRAIDKLRSVKPFDRDFEELSDLIPLDFDLDDEVARNTECETIASVIRSLDPPDDQIFTRRYYYNQKIKQIAAELGLSSSFVKTRLERAKVGIREKLIALGITM